MNDARIGITAARRAAEQAALVQNLGGVPVVASALIADAPEPDEEIGPAVTRLIDEPFDVVVFLTGVGAKVIFDYARRHGRDAELRERLAGAQVVARGTKPRRALRALGVEVDVVVDPPVTTAVRDLVLGDVTAGRRYFVQGFGPEPVELTEPLRAAGADVVTLSPYAASLPDDPTAVADLARQAAAGALAAVTFTSVLAARQFVAIADDAGIDVDALNAAPTLIVTVGQVTRAALEDTGLRVDLEPETPRMGAMYQALAARLCRSD